jgi:hypothetical protein
MKDHRATWARIMEMARARFPRNEPTAEASRGSRTTWRRQQDADDKERTILDATCGEMRLCADLCTELQEEPNASIAAYRSARVVARAMHAEFLHVFATWVGARHRGAHRGRRRGLGRLR